MGQAYRLDADFKDHIKRWRQSKTNQIAEEVAQVRRSGRWGLSYSLVLVLLLRLQLLRSLFLPLASSLFPLPVVYLLCAGNAEEEGEGRAYNGDHGHHRRRVLKRHDRFEDMGVLL